MLALKPEERLSLQVCNLLNIRGVYYFHVPNEGKRHWGAVRTFRVNGGKAGVADLVLLLKGGRCVFVELKADKGKQSVAQLKFENRVKVLGFEYYIWRSVDDANTFCNAITKGGAYGNGIF